MKKFFESVMMFTAVLAAVASCNKNEVDPQVPAEGYRYSFSVVNDDTRATLDNEGVAWEANDQVGMFLEGYTGYAKIDMSTTPRSVILYSRQAIPANSYAYAYYPYSSANSVATDKEAAKIVLSKNQEGGVNAAMPMAGIPFKVEAEVPLPEGETSTSTNGQIKFLNLGSIIDFKIYSSTYADETIQYVTFKADGAVLSGDAYLDLTAVDAADESTLELVWMGGDNEFDYVKVAQEAPVASAKADATSIYMVVAPGTYSGTITIGTDVATYTFSYTNKELARNVIKHYNMNLNNATRSEGAVEVVKDLPYSEEFTSGKGEFEINDVTLPDGVSSIWEFTSQYGAKVTSHIGETDYNAESWLVSPWINLTEVVNAVVTFDHVSRYAGSNSEEMTFWALSDDADAQWTKLTIPTYSPGNNWSFVNSGEISLYGFAGKKVKVAFKYIGTTDNAGTWEIKNFVATAAKAPAGIAYAEDAQSFSVEIGDDFTAPELINPNNLTVTYTSNKENVASVNATSGAVTIGEVAGTATITATFEGNDNYLAGTASYTITVTDPNATTVTDILDREFTGVSSTSYTNWSGKTGVSGAVYAGNSAGSNNAIQLRSNNNNSGIVTTTSGGHVTKVTVTWNSNTLADRTLDIYGKNSVYSAASDLYDEEKQGVLLGSIVCGTSTSLIVTGDYTFIGLRSNNNAMYLDEVQIEWSGSAPVVTTYQINLEDVDNGTISANFVEAAEGTIVTLTATPAEGYSLVAWSVVDDDDNAIEVTNNQFSMPASDVYVSASFAPAPDDQDVLVYTLDPVATGGNSSPHNSYTAEATTTISGIEWAVTGNSSMVPWRIGGKSLDGVDREVYSKTPMSHSISKIEITHGAASSITVNSMTVIVATDANFSNKVSTLTPTFEANSTVTVECPDGADWTNCYYKVIYNVSVSVTSNKYLEFIKAEFFGN